MRFSRSGRVGGDPETAMDFSILPALTFGWLYCHFVIAHDHQRELSLSYFGAVPGSIPCAGACVEAGGRLATAATDNSKAPT